MHSVFLVYYEYCKVKIASKGYPEQIRNLKICGEGADFSEFQNHNKDYNPQKNEPYK
jgi:hypothetical protein